MLARMNFAGTIAFNQRFNLARDSASSRSTPQELLDYMLDRLSAAPYEDGPLGELVTFLQTGATWPVTDAQLQTKANGLARLIVGSSEYQFV
jgi:hypothetical protein